MACRIRIEATQPDGTVITKEISIPGPVPDALYSLWLESGHDGSMLDFLNSMRGKSAFDNKEV